MNRNDLKRLIRESFEQMRNKDSQNLFSGGSLEEDEDPASKWKELTERSIDPGNKDFKEMVVDVLKHKDIFPHVLEALLAEEHAELRDEIYRKIGKRP